ncbi:MAG: hypothetical protein V1755_10120 [Chloroflexota bacterium]
MSTMTRRLPRLSLVLLAGACTLVVILIRDSLWATSVDLGLHYALVVRIMDIGHAPTTVDASLGLMNGYPSLGHTLAAVLAKSLGSALAGMQLTAVVSLTFLWAGLGLMLGSLPRRQLLVLFVAVPSVLLLNRLLVHLELFGTELLGNFFFAQLVAQAAAIGSLALALYLERAQFASGIRYALLGASVPVIAQIHPLPALEILVVLIFQLALDSLSPRTGDRRRALALGLFIVCASVVMTVLSPGFTVIRRNSENDGLLELIHTPEPMGLAVESAIVIVISAILLAQWARLGREDAQRGSLIHKYWAFLGAAIAVLCLLQFIMLVLGFGSPYAVKKYAFGLNSVLLLDVPLLMAAFIRTPLADPRAARSTTLAALGGHAFPALFVLISVFAWVPATSTRMASVQEILPLERFAMKYRESDPGSISGKYDYAAGLFQGNRVVDFMISLGVLQAPQTRNVDDFLWGRPPTNPRRVGRLFTRLGFTPWDVSACRQLVTPDGFAILDASCVLRVVSAIEE